jgi:ribonucleoside-diphosphate reductase subunit M1
VSVHSNIYTRRVLAGEFQIVCPWLLRELVDLGLWNDQMKNMIIAHNGSVQNIPGIPDNVKAIYKTVWEVSQKKVLDLAADRGAFICQSQSLNVHLQAPTLGQLTSMHFYGWKKGLKTGMYYLRTRPAAQAIQFTVDQTLLADAKKVTKDASVKEASGRVEKSFRNNAIAPPTTDGSHVPHGLSSSSSITSSTSSSPITVAESAEQRLASLSLDEKTMKVAEADPEFAAALRRQRDREEEEAKLICSLENKEACVMCSG